jgi:hypothetical protein
MLALIIFNLVPIAVAFLIGLVTARWAFRRRPEAAPRSESNADS